MRGIVSVLVLQLVLPIQEREWICQCLLRQRISARRLYYPSEQVPLQRCLFLLDHHLSLEGVVLELVALKNEESILPLLVVERGRRAPKRVEVLHLFQLH